MRARLGGSPSHCISSARRAGSSSAITRLKPPPMRLSCAVDAIDSPFWFLNRAALSGLARARHLQEHECGVQLLPDFSAWPRCGLQSGKRDFQGAPKDLKALPRQSPGQAPRRRTGGFQMEQAMLQMLSAALADPAPGLSARVIPMPGLSRGENGVGRAENGVGRAESGA